ncbi:1-phosphofructokinase family hexose kinase [Fluviibacterium sp. DFM31]|uniref:Phosphofructokinase n=1 Tax=Meridianimarinicoccus marinus TaxID=3231483 RepID=A0ABV3L6I1_9RHOB
MAHPAILTITLNPALDLSSQVDQVRAGDKLRCAPPRRDPGGGGINVSRAIRHMGGESLAVVALGGATGEAVRQMMTAEGLSLRVLPLPGETRQSLSVTDQSNNDQYRFVMPGPDWQETEVEALLDLCATLPGPATLAVLSGSLPPGVAPSLPHRICAALEATGARMIIDTSGAGLVRLARAPQEQRPMVLRFDNQEAEELSGTTLDSPEATADLAEDLVRRGVADAVVIACGAEGNVLCDGSRRLLCRPVPVPVRSKVGAGDSFVGAFALTLSRGGDLAEALHHGTAAANAAVMTDATELCRAEDVERLYPGCQLSEV